MRARTRTGVLMGLSLVGLLVACSPVVSPSATPATETPPAFVPTATADVTPTPTPVVTPVAPATPAGVSVTPIPNTTFSGPLGSAPSISGGTISFVISESGQIVEMELETGPATFECGGGRTVVLHSTQGRYKFADPLAIEGGRFSTSAVWLKWDGVFDSGTSAGGSIQFYGTTRCQILTPSVTWSAAAEGP
jgi:hypothetical protein